MSVLGLSARQRVAARARLRVAAVHVARNRGAIHYTQRGRRWDFIRNRCRPGHHAYYADCSALSTWLLWTSTARVYGIADFVNGSSWAAGYTGTMVRHGQRIRRPRLVGDCVFYGGTRWVPGHVATYIGGGYVISHGSEAGPMIVPWAYRPVNQVRRYIR